MRSIGKLLATFSLVLFFFGCELDSGENFYFINLEVVSADFPENFILGETHEITVNYRRPDDCTLFEGFDVLSPDDSTRNVVAIGTVFTNDDCSDTNDEVGATLYFTVISSETYLFRFYSGRDNGERPIYVEYEIEVVNDTTDQ